MSESALSRLSRTEAGLQPAEPGYPLFTLSYEAQAMTVDQDSRSVPTAKLPLDFEAAFGDNEFRYSHVDDLLSLLHERLRGYPKQGCGA
jgi:hypothetical protein